MTHHLAENLPFCLGKRRLRLGIRHDLPRFHPEKFENRDEKQRDEKDAGICQAIGIYLQSAGLSGFPKTRNLID